MRNLILPFIAVAVLAAGCSKQAEVIDPNTNNAETRVVGVMPEAIVFSDATLSFASMEALEAQVEALATMPAEAKAAWYAAYPEFVSMERASAMVNAQMHEVGTKEGALEMRKPYAELFIFDPNTDVVNGSPFYKVSKLNYAMVCNAYGDVTVGGAVVNLNDLTSYEQTWFAKAMDETVTAKASQYVLLPTLIINEQVPYARAIIRGDVELDQYSQYQLAITYTSQALINTDLWLAVSDVFVVTFEGGVTNVNPLTTYAGIYGSISYTGAYGNVYTFDGGGVRQIVGASKSSSIRTGYHIRSHKTGSVGGVYVIRR